MYNDYHAEIVHFAALLKREGWYTAIRCQIQEGGPPTRIGPNCRGAKRDASRNHEPSLLTPIDQRRGFPPDAC
jgi:hypothetical protein